MMLSDKEISQDSAKHYEIDIRKDTLEDDDNNCYLNQPETNEKSFLDKRLSKKTTISILSTNEMKFK